MLFSKSLHIGEVARKVGVATSAIRFYEEAGLLPEPERTGSGYRTYDPSVIGRLRFIRAGQGVGLSLKDLGEVLRIRDSGSPPCSHVSNLISKRIEEVDERIRDLRRLKKELAAIKATASAFDPTECDPEGVCQILDQGSA